MEPWKTRNREAIYQHGHRLTLERHTVELPDGKLLDDWLWLQMPDYVIVVAVTPDDRFLCFRQTKYAVDGLTLAPVGGYIERGEDPLLAAKRELLEETGHESADWHALGTYTVDANRGAGRAYLYLARGITPADTVAASDDLEEQELVMLTRDETRDALRDGEFKALAWAAAVALALLYF